MISEQHRRMLECGMRAPLAPLLAEQVRECDRLVEEGLMTCDEGGYVTTEVGRRMYDAEMRRIGERARGRAGREAPREH